MIAIVDYGMGNLGSVKRKLDLIGTGSVITSSPGEIEKADKIILPGVGHFGKAMDRIRARGLLEVLNHEAKARGKPILGICLGMQLMAKGSEEGNSEGFGWLDANVIKFHVTDKLRNKVPHTGWNTIAKRKESLLLSNLSFEEGFYFIHSYHLECNDRNDILSETFYEYNFVSSVERENLFGVQFHPEKSHREGEKLLLNFVKL